MSGGRGHLWGHLPSFSSRDPQKTAIPDGLQEGQRLRRTENPPTATGIQILGPAYYGTLLRSVFHPAAQPVIGA
jgi:hypothetical protein